VNKKHRYFWAILGAISVALFLLTLWGIAAVAQMARELPDPADFSNRSVAQSTKIFDRTGEVLLFEIHGDQKRTVIPFDKIPDYAKQATLAIEDQRFYEHQAISWPSLVRAALVNLLEGGFVQGGSTITQQVAKNAFLTPEKTLSRKIKELILAYWIEKRYSKDEILHLYLNQVPYGSNAYGIEAASRTYFAKPGADLSLAESALLAAMLKAPSYYSPWGTHTAELLNRKNYILEQMRDLGFIDKQQYQTARDEKLTFTPPGTGTILAPHFVMFVRDYLTQKYGEDLVSRGGLRVVTTLDVKLQEIADRVVKEGAARNTELYNGRNAALVAADPKTGQVLAMVGSKDYSAKPEPAGCTPGSCQFEGNFNVATQGERQPGSSIKPFAYIAAFKKGYTPDTVLFDLPTEFSKISTCPLTGINYFDPNPQCFHPQNFDNIFRGPVNLRHSLAQSINIPSVKTLYLAGLSNTLALARDFGITTLTDPSRYGLSLVLGGGEVKLFDLVSAYSVLSQEGIRHTPATILRVEDAEGNVLEEFVDFQTQVIEPQYARLINDILSDVEARAPLFSGSLNLTVFPDRDVALKTGTTNDYRDAWAMGYTPSLTVGVWAGNNNNLSMQKRAGSILAAIPIWSAFLKEALPVYPEESFARPDPTPSPKPVLNGTYIVDGQAHSILYHLDKDNPLGPAPQNPSADPQFPNWETPISLWAQSASGRQSIEETIRSWSAPLAAPSSSTPL